MRVLVLGTKVDSGTAKVTVELLGRLRRREDMVSDNVLASIETLGIYILPCVVNRIPYFARGARYDT